MTGASARGRAPQEEKPDHLDNSTRVPGQVAPAASGPAPDRAVILRVVGLCKRYDTKPVLERVSFAVEKGSVFTISGPSGAGKTTLVRILAGLTGFDDGTVTVGDATIHAGDAYPKQLYGKIGVVFQDLYLFPHLTALDNVRLALVHARGMKRAEATDRSRLELARVGLAELEDRYPSALSGGERQRVAIARALAVDPFLLILDEPTSSLDTSAVGGILDVIRKLAEAGTTMVVSTHNLRFAAAIGQQVSVLDGGRLEVSPDVRLLARLEAGWE